MRADDWGWRTRVGILVIDKDQVAESEFWAMRPPGVTVHSARFASPRRPGTEHYGAEPARVVAESPDLLRGLDFLGRMDLGAICVCFTTGSFFGGVRFDDQFTATATEHAHGTPVTSAAIALTSAMRATGIGRPFLVVTPWFKAAIVEAAQRYFVDAGFDPAGVLKFDLGPGWHHLQPWEIWDADGQSAVHPEEVYRQVRLAFPADADGVVIVGNGFRCAEAIAPLEADLGVPVITSNQAGIWHSLRLAGVSPPTDGNGLLFSAGRRST